jgi:hypothetical protein
MLIAPIQSKFNMPLNRIEKFFKPVVDEDINVTTCNSYMVHPKDSKLYKLHNFDNSKGNVLFLLEKNTKVNITQNGNLRGMYRMCAYVIDDLTPDIVVAMCKTVGIKRTFNEEVLQTVVSDVYSGVYHYDPTYPTEGKKTHSTVDQQIQAMPDARPVPETINTALYQEFKKRMNTFGGHHPAIYSGKTLKSGPCKSIDVYSIKKKRKARQFTNKRTPVSAGVLPKIGTPDSQGNMRLVYPMSMSLQEVHAISFGFEKYIPEDGNITRVFGPKFPKKKILL